MANGDITLTRTEALDLAGTLDDAIAALADTDKLTLALELHDCLALILDRLFPNA